MATKKRGTTKPEITPFLPHERDLGERSAQDEDLDLVRMLEHEGYEEGAQTHRFLVYDLKDKDWSFVGHGHAPAHLERCCPPPEFAPLLPALGREAKRYVMHKVLRFTRGANKALLNWALGWGAS